MIIRLRTSNNLHRATFRLPQINSKVTLVKDAPLTDVTFKYVIWRFLHGMNGRQWVSLAAVDESIEGRHTD